MRCAPSQEVVSACSRSSVTWGERSCTGADPDDSDDVVVPEVFYPTIQALTGQAISALLATRLPTRIVDLGILDKYSEGKVNLEVPCFRFTGQVSSGAVELGKDRNQITFRLVDFTLTRPKFALPLKANLDQMERIVCHEWSFTYAFVPRLTRAGDKVRLGTMLLLSHRNSD